MSEPLSIAASVAGLITISAQIVGMAKDLFDKVKDAPETMMRVREEVESMQPIFCQVHLLLNGSGSGLNHGNLTMISIHNLMTTLTGCVIVYSRLEKKVNEVCGFNDPTTATAVWKRAGVVADRVKWGLWRHEEVLVIIEDLQRQKQTLNLMLTIITCTTTTQASEGQARLQELCIELLQSSHAHSALLRDLITRQEEHARVLEEIHNRDRPNMSTLGGTGSHPSDNCDNASIISKRSTFSLRLGRHYMEDLKASRAYKRLGHFGLGIDSSKDSVFSFDSACSTGNWSMLSDITLGDLSVSQIAVLNLPIDLSDVSNPEPFQDRLSVGTPRSPSNSQPRSKRSSRGRIHNAIETGNGFVVRALLTMGMDIEELDSNGRTPLVHAIMKRQEAICKLLLEKGASRARGASDNETLLTHAAQLLNNLDIHDNGSLDYICEELLDNRPNADIKTVGKMIVACIAVRMHDLVKKGYKSILQLLSLMESRDAEGWTPLASAAFMSNEVLCEFLMEKGCSLCLDTEQKQQLKPKLSPRVHVAAGGGHKTALQLLLDIGADINEKHPDVLGRTPLLEAVFHHQLSCVKILIERGANATVLSDSKRTVLHYASWYGSEHIMKFLLDSVVETRKLVDAQNSSGDTPLHACCSEINYVIALENAKMLLHAGATLIIKNKAGKTPYECARRLRNKELAKYVWSQLSPEQQAQEIRPPLYW